MPALIFLSYFSLFTLSLLDNARGPFYPEILSDLQVNATQGSMFFAVTSLFAFAGSWASHLFVGHGASARILGWSSLALGGGFVAIAGASTMPLLLLSCAVFGLAFGALNLFQNVLIYEAAPERLRRRVFNGLHAMYGLASLAAPLLVSAFRDWGWSWRETFVVLAAMPAVCGALAVTISLPSIAAKPVNKAGQGDREVAPLSFADADWRVVFAYALVLALYLWGELSISTRLVLWLRKDRGFTPDGADLYLSLFFAALFAGRVVFTAVNFRGLGNWLILSLSAGLSTVLYYCGLYWEPSLFGLCGLTLAPFYPVLMEQLTVRFGDRSSQAMGFVIGSGSLSVVFMHVLIGVVSDRAGLTEALALCALMLGLLTLGLIWRAAALIMTSS